MSALMCHHNALLFSLASKAEAPYHGGAINMAMKRRHPRRRGGGGRAIIGKAKARSSNEKGGVRRAPKNKSYLIAWRG